ncbi:MAG TPA: hypothetical protein VGS08_04090 [Candidatus Saccharimonadales bacterium]|nr:hypothetical protein [Candidatus Saccharimonadales bacterium]
MKKPWLAALLNVVSGLGYIYLNFKRPLGWLVLASTLLGFASQFDTSSTYTAWLNSPYLVWDWLSLASFLMLWIAFIIDGFMEAKRMNSQDNSKSSKVEIVSPEKEKHIEATKVATPNERRKGLLLSLLAIPAGIVGWDILWRYGFIASIVSWGIAYLALKLYRKGSGSNPDKDAAQFLIGIVTIGVVLSLLSGIIMDAQLWYSGQYHVSTFQAYTSTDFWSTVLNNLTTNGALWGSYVSSIVISVIFAALGCYRIIRYLFTLKYTPATTAKN